MELGPSTTSANMTDPQQIAITLIPMVTGTLSIIASTTIIAKVLQSRTKLSTPYNRLLMGLCVFDILVSTCHALSTLPVPKDRPGYWLALGNDTTCKAQGTLMVFSIIGAPVYNLAFCIYFLCVIKYNMTDERFQGLWEPYLHAFPILYGVGAATYTLAAGYINPDATMCKIISRFH